MKIKNISNKIIGIGDFILLPDETQDIPSKFAESTAVSIYKSARFIEIIAQDEKTEPATKTAKETEVAPVEEVAKETVEETAEETKEDKLARLKDATDEEVAAMAKELGINMATCKTQADVRKKVTKALSK